MSCLQEWGHPASAVLSFLCVRVLEYGMMDMSFKRKLKYLAKARQTNNGG